MCIKMISDKKTPQIIEIISNYIVDIIRDIRDVICVENHEE